MRIRRERAEIAGPRSPEPAQKRGDLKNSPNLGGTTKQACSRPKPGDGSIFFAPAAFWRTVERLILHSKFAGAAQHFLLLLQKKTLAKEKEPEGISISPQTPLNRPRKPLRFSWIFPAIADNTQKSERFRTEQSPAPTGCRAMKVDFPAKRCRPTNLACTFY